MSETLSDRALNRTLLQRQMLLERSMMPPLDAVEHLVGLQAQLPLDPYYALWSRLEGFDPTALAGPMERHEAVRLVVMRGTLHLVTVPDARALWPRMEPVLEKVWGGTAWGRQVRALPPEEYDALREEARRLLRAEHLPAARLSDGLHQRFEDLPQQALRSLTYVLPVVQITPRGVWGKTLQPTWANLDDWIGKPLRKPIPLPTLIRRYLAAFGPASVADFQNWSRLQAMREPFEGMLKKLRTYRSESGRELFDLPDAPLAAGDEPAPPRFLPTYDNVVLGHDDRSRIVPASERPATSRPEDRNVGSVLIDGMVSAVWTVAASKDTAVLTVETFRAITKREQADVAQEATALLAFAHPGAAHDVAFRPYEGPPDRTK